MEHLESWQIAYMAAWATACLCAASVFAVRRQHQAIWSRSYWRLLAQPWKLALFVVSGGALMFMAPYTGDPTWDYVDAGFMALFAFTTAPWTVGTLYHALRGRVRLPEIFVAACAWMFSSSWSYDGYLVLRDGVYPSTWAANIFASGFLYLANGLLYSLERGDDRYPVTLSFLDPGWPAVEPTGLSREMVLVAAVICVPVGIALGAFLVTELWL